MSMMQRNVRSEKFQPSFLIERIKKGKFTIRNRMPHVQFVMNDIRVAIPAVPPNVNV